ncbi:MAG: hypothetical protein JXA18_06290 [Chitinispirillaceae bacterium]|nr:hypothetical protein [Chitinispirillaceae bacterium]
MGKRNVTLPVQAFVFVGLFSIGNSVVAAASIDLNFNNSYQTIHGIGVNCADCTNPIYIGMSDSARNAFMDVTFRQDIGIGVTMIRQKIVCGIGSGSSQEGTIEPSEGVWDSTHCDAEAAMMRAARERGCPIIMSSPWSPPAWMKTNNATSSRGGDATTNILDPTKYQAFADYLSYYCRLFKSKWNIDIDCISPQNEPSLNPKWDGCVYTPQTYLNLVKNYVIPTFARDSVRTKLLVGDDCVWGERYVKICFDSCPASAIGFAGGHIYGGGTGGIVPTGPLQSAVKAGKDVWMTEWTLNNGIATVNADSMNQVIGCAINMTKMFGSVKITVWSLYNLQGGLGITRRSGNRVTLQKGFWALGNFSKFVRPGYKSMYNGYGGANDVYYNAFKDTVTNNYAIIVVNNNGSAQAITFTLANFPGSICNVYETSSASNLDKVHSSLDLSAGDTVPAYSITTYVYVTTTSTVPAHSPKNGNGAFPDNDNSIIPIESPCASLIKMFSLDGRLINSRAISRKNVLPRAHIISYEADAKSRRAKKKIIIR